MERSRRFMWRVRDPRGGSRTNAFDAILLPANPSEGEPVRHLGLPIPYESDQLDKPVTLVVRARRGTGSVLVECAVFAPDGTRIFSGSSTDTETVIVRSPHGLEVRRLPEGEPDPFEAAT